MVRVDVKIEGPSIQRAISSQKSQMSDTDCEVPGHEVFLDCSQDSFSAFIMWSMLMLMKENTEEIIDPWFTAEPVNLASYLSCLKLHGDD